MRSGTVVMVRRHFVNSLLGSGILATLASIFYPILKFVIPPETAESAVMSATAGRLEISSQIPENFSVRGRSWPGGPHGRAGMEGADAALEELAFRRTGLGYALIAIAAAVFGLILKIRDIERLTDGQSPDR